MIYEYIIVGAGIAGSSIAHELKQHSKKILVLEKNTSIQQSASAAAGAFLSPLLGKPNEFKDLVNTALEYSVEFYKNNCPQYINNCGTTRIPSDENAQKQFQSYKPYIDFDYKEQENGYFFPIGSVVRSHKICEFLLKDVEVLYDFTVTKIEKKDSYFLINDQLLCENLILATGAYIELIGEKYFNIRPVWGQRIDIKTSSCITHNYHKNCSLSVSTKIDENTNLASIGATHHRFVLEKKTNKEDTQKLLTLAQEIYELKDIEVINEIAGARAASVDYFPMVGSLVDSQQTLLKFPYIKSGSKVPADLYVVHHNLFVLNGVGGRGFVLSPYLAKLLKEYIIDNKPLPQSIATHRLFTRWARKIKDDKNE